MPYRTSTRHHIRRPFNPILTWLGCVWLSIGLIAHGQDESKVTQVDLSAQANAKLQAIEARILGLISKIKPAVVCIQGGGGSGSGVIVSPDGLVLTAAHVIDKANELTIIYPDGRKFRGKALGTYGPADAGMAKILEGAPHPFVEVNDGKNLEKDDFVIALGHPSGFDIQRGPPLRIGHITAVEDNFIETDTALIGGDSGGPSFDLDGRVIGIHSHITGAIQVNRDSHIAKFHEHWKLMENGEHDPIHYSKAIGGGQTRDPLVLGLKLMDSESNNGLIIDSVMPNSPASTSELQAGDVLRQVNGRPIGTAQAFLQQMSSGAFGESIQLQVEREGRTFNAAIELIYESELDGGRSPLRDRIDKPRDPPKLPAEPPREDNDSKVNRAGQSTRLQELAQQAKANGGKLKLSREDLRMLREGLAKRTEALAPAGGTRILDDWAQRWQDASRSLMAPLAPSILRMHSGGRPVGLATCVHRNGLFITKASEAKNREIQIEVPDKGLCHAVVVETDDAIDIALIQVSDIPCFPIPVEAWLRDKSPTPMGSMCFAAGPLSKTAGFGVVSVPARPLDGKTGAYIGVQVEPANEGVVVKAMPKKSPAAKAGIKVGDKLKSIDQKEIRSEQQLQEIVQAHAEGEVLRVEVERGDALISISVTLEDGTQLAPMPGAREQALDGATAALSKRRWGFEVGIQHDCALSSRDVGGPLVDLKGRIVGINIARAGRIQSYAIPSYRILQFLEGSQHWNQTKPKSEKPVEQDKGGL